MKQQSKTEVCRKYRIPTYETRVETIANELSIYYHATEIATIREDAIKINNGGYNTQTTKKRINAVLDFHNLPYRLFQKNFTWYLHDFRTGADFLFNRSTWINLSNFDLIEVY